MAKEKKNADVEALKDLETAQATPAPVTSNDVSILLQTVRELTQRIGELENPKVKSRLTQHEREFKAKLREFVNEEGETVGIIKKIVSPRQVKDKETGQKIGVCDVLVYNPNEDTTTEFKRVNYLQTLNESPHVNADITNWEKRKKVEFLRNGVRFEQLKQDEVPADTNFAFEHEIVINEFTLAITSGAFKGCVMKDDGFALNI